MDAILISEENADKIATHFEEHELEQIDLGPYIRHHKNWYVVRGYYPYLGAPIDYGILPQYMLDRVFDYDPIIICTEWDLIVRK